MAPTRLGLAVLAAFALGCGSGSADDLSLSSVTHIPDGSGTGTAASGTYTVQLDVTGCSGACAATYGGLSFSICNVGPAGSAVLTATQSGGHLVVHSDTASLAVHDLSGGIDANGDFDIGGVATAVEGQNLTVTTRATGTLNGNAATGTALSLGNGTVDGSAINCVQTAVLTGSRTAM